MKSAPRRAIACILATTICATTATSGFADSAQQAAADQLFDDAKTLMEAGQYAEACPKLEESQRLDPQQGTLLRLAFCYEHVGRLATAWTLYRDGLAIAKKVGNAQRIDFATKRMAIVEPRLSKLTVIVSGAAKDLVVRWDGKPFVAGSAVPVDGGKHVLTVTAPGKKPYETTVTIAAERDAKTVTIPALEDPPVIVTATTSTPRSNVPAVVAFSAAGVFAGGAIVSRVLMGNAKDDYTATCALQQTPGPCGDDADKNRGKMWEALSLVSAGLGVAALGTGIVLFATGSASSEPKAGLAITPTLGMANGISISGAF